MTTVVAIVSDGHPNSTVGLCPPAINLDDHGTYRASKAQGWLWRKWIDYWKGIDRLKVEHNATCVVVFNGDMGELDKKGGTQVITRNRADILNIMRAVVQPGLDVADVYFFTRGTAVHVGPSGDLEEELANDLDAEQDPDGNCSWANLYAEFSGVTFDIQHHPDHMGYLPHTMKLAAGRQSSTLLHQYSERHEMPPSVAVRSHIHYFADSGIESWPRVFYTWGWQLRPQYTKSTRVRPVGGLAFVCADGNFTPIPNKSLLPKRKAWTIKSRKTT